MMDRRNKADGDAPYRTPRPEEARRDCAAAGRATRERRVLQRILTIAAAFCLAVTLAGCRSVDVMDMADVPVRHWHHGVELKLTPPDTQTLYDLDLLIRYNHNFTVDTLTLWFRTRSNDTLVYTERCRFELPMSQRPAAIRPVVSLPWRCGVRFSAQEPCRIRITPLQPVRGIEAVGIRLRPVTPTQEDPQQE